MIILIPPSERKQEGGTSPPLRTLHPITQELLRKAETTNKKQLYKSRTQEAITLNAAVKTSPSMPAIHRYQGVVYDAIGYDTLTKQAFFNKHVRIISGLFGLLKPTQNIPNYKFPITLLGAAKKWRQTITQEIGDEYVIDLLPNTHKKAISYADGWEVVFTREKNGKVVRAGHAGKTIKGKFIRWVCQNALTDVEEMKKFCEDGYAWNGKTFHKNE